MFLFKNNKFWLIYIFLFLFSSSYSKGLLVILDFNDLEKNMNCSTQTYLKNILASNLEEESNLILTSSHVLDNLILNESILKPNLYYKKVAKNSKPNWQVIYSDKDFYLLKPKKKYKKLTKFEIFSEDKFSKLNDIIKFISPKNICLFAHGIFKEDKYVYGGLYKEQILNLLDFLNNQIFLDSIYLSGCFSFKIFDFLMDELPELKFPVFIGNLNIVNVELPSIFQISDSEISAFKIKIGKYFRLYKKYKKNDDLADLINAFKHITPHVNLKRDWHGITTFPLYYFNKEVVFMDVYSCLDYLFKDYSYSFDYSEKKVLILCDEEIKNLKLSSSLVKVGTKLKKLLPVLLLQNYYREYQIDHMEVDVDLMDFLESSIFPFYSMKNINSQACLLVKELICNGKSYSNLFINFNKKNVSFDR
ncbi:hypothetical protein GF385_00025 [Candidatus Dependentiae bacterium]|nr:hypothetical protein [Candidatus Dependentiae bacterium]